MSTVGIIDYGVGNLFSVTCALEHVGARVDIVSNEAEIKQAERLILPGVGAFAKGMDELAKRNLIEPIKAHVASGKPLLGICLGMQMLLDYSDEFGHTEGLGFFKGGVKAIPVTGADGRPHRIPHVGWNELRLPGSAPDERWGSSLLEAIEPLDSVYFANSFHAVCENPADVISSCHYNGRILTAAIKSGQTYGVQFHPERSGPVGLKIIKNFLEIQNH